MTQIRPATDPKLANPATPAVPPSVTEGIKALLDNTAGAAAKLQVKEPTREELAAAVKAKIDAAHIAVQAKNTEIQKLQRQLTEVQATINTLQLEYEKLTFKSEAESHAEWLAACKRDREERAAAYRNAVDNGIVTPAMALKMGVGAAPCDQAIAARNRAKGVKYLGGIR